MAREGRSNLLLLADTYKVSHHMQYPPNTTFLHSYFESRGGKFDKLGNRTVEW
jgi:nicotinamide phosphoribosyltransferase